MILRRAGGKAYSNFCTGTIPKGQNSPRCVRFGLYAEQMTASAFVAPRHLNKKVCRSIVECKEVTKYPAGMAVQGKTGSCSSRFCKSNLIRKVPSRSRLRP